MSLPSPLHRVALLSMHTSPLAQPGSGDAGGMNVFVLNTARELARQGIDVDIFTRATESSNHPIAEDIPGVSVHHILAGPLDTLNKYDLWAELCSFTQGVMRVVAQHPEGYYDLIHSHYWISGQVGMNVAQQCGLPLVHTFHTVAAVKNATLAQGDSPEPDDRLRAENAIARAATRLTANTRQERQDLLHYLSATPDEVDIIPPGVDCDVFVAPGPQSRQQARRHLGLPEDGQIIAFVGRIQALKGPDVLVDAAAEILRRTPSRPLTVMIVGEPSGSGMGETSLHQQVSDLGIEDSVVFFGAQPPQELVHVFHAADVVAVPSHNESFGMVALEAQACGTPVVATRVGGLPLAIDAGRTGLLVDGHDSGRWADALTRLLDDDDLRHTLGEAAAKRALLFSWERAAERLITCYTQARVDYRTGTKAE